MRATVFMYEFLYRRICVCQRGLRVRVQRHRGWEGGGGVGLTVNRRPSKYFMNKAFKSEQEQLVSTVRPLCPPRPD